MQVLPHASIPLAQGWQPPAAQVSFDAQRVPQAPQFAGSEATSTHPDAQRAVPSAHATSSGASEPVEASPPCDSIGGPATGGSQVPVPPPPVPLSLPWQPSNTTVAQASAAAVRTRLRIPPRESVDRRIVRLPITPGYGHRDANLSSSSTLAWIGRKRPIYLHMPMMHRPESQTVPHAPQFVLLVAVLTHWPLQSVRPVMHLQAPVWQVAAAGHVVPHVPQLKLLV